MAGLPGAGETFGRYDLTRRIGRGGMGVVYEATHRDLQRPVALKLLSMDLLDNEALRNRFIREAQALAAVDSPMIVPVFDAGEHDGWLYIATKLFRDGDLSDWIHEHGALSQEESVSVLVQVAEGLADAHEAGFLHRDIKPSNILLQRRAGGLRAVICDFGIAFAEGSEHTKTVGVIGTLGYMAPERHEGLPATAASDVYSLGCVLYACLQGRAPWVGTDVKVAMGHLYNPVPQIPEGADAINDVLLRALAKDPDDRYQTAADFRAALLRLGEPEESTVIVDLTHEENLAPAAPPDMTYLLPPASTSARRPVGDTIVPPVAAVPETVVPPEPDSLVPAPAIEAVTPIADDTVVPLADGRDVPVSDGTVVPGAVLAAPSVAPRPISMAWFTRRRTAWVSAAVLLVGALVTALTVSGDNDSSDSAVAIADSAASEPAVTPGQTKTPEPEISPAFPPRVHPRAGANEVVFGLSLPAFSPSDYEVEYREDSRDAVWRTASGGRARIKTIEGGKRACVLARVSVPTGTGVLTGPTAHACGRSQPRRLLLRVSGDCSKPGDPCTELTMTARGFRSQRWVDVSVYIDGSPDTEGCSNAKGEVVPCFSGRTTDAGELVRSITFSYPATVAVEAAGLKSSVEVP